MKLNRHIKKLFLVTFLGGFCMPAQAMWLWDSAKNLVPGFLSSQQRDVSLAELLMKEEFFECSRDCSRERIFNNCYSKVNEKVNGKDSKNKRALDYAIEYDDAETVYSLLRLGADSDDVIHDAIIMRLSDFIFHKKYSRHVYCELLIKIGNYNLIKGFSQKYLQKMIDTYSLYAYARTIELPFTGNDLKNNVEEYMLSHPQPDVFGSPLEKMLLLMLSLRDTEMLERFMPFTVNDTELLQMFNENVEKFTCNEYKEELQSMMKCEMIRVKRKQTLHYILVHKKCSDVAWTCK